jgi:hypothetical protein
MNNKHAITKMLSSACPSIRYRLRKEILDESISSKTMLDLQGQILDDRAVNSICGSQQPDGWLGRRFHGYDSHEAAVRLLCEKGVEPRQPQLARALEVIERDAGRIEQDMGRVGKVFDDLELGGSRLIGAATLACAGIEDALLVREQLALVLKSLESILTVSSILEISEIYKEKRVFNQGVKWPGIYHLRLLAFTHSWRNCENIELATKAVQKIVELAPIPYILVRHGSQLIAPAAFAMQDFCPGDLFAMRGDAWMAWFHRIELLARIGVIEKIPALKMQTDVLEYHLANNGGWFVVPLSHEYFKHWGSYTGLMLESDWKTAERRIFDLTFRSLLILNFAGKMTQR